MADRSPSMRGQLAAGGGAADAVGITGGAPAERRERRLTDGVARVRDAGRRVLIFILAGLAVGFWESAATLEAHWQKDRTFEPAMSRDVAEERMMQWQKAVAKSRGWIAA